MIVVRPESGLCNRLRVISSFRVLARMAGRDFAVCWMPGPGFSGEKLDDLFEHDLRLVDEQEYDAVSSNALRLDEAVTIEGALEERTWTWTAGVMFEQVFDRDIPIVTYRGVHRCDDLLSPARRADVFGDDFHEEYAGDVRTWRPTSDIRKAVDRVARRFRPSTVGVHIRRGDAWEGQSPTSVFRRSTDAAFVAAMDRELELDPATSFFLATDSPDTEARFRERYGRAVLTNAKKRFVPSRRGSAKENQRDAVIDLFALARTSRVIGSHYSSFSKFAAVLGDVPYNNALVATGLEVHERLRRARQSADTTHRTAPRDTVASFAVNGVGLGHTSRLVAVHDELRRATSLSSLLFLERRKELVEDYGFDQVALPRFTGMYLETGGEPEADASRRARAMVELTLEGTRPVVLHDVFVHRPLYEAAVDAGWPQALIYRPRRDVIDPAAWTRRCAPAISVVFWIGADGLIDEADDVSVYGVQDVVRRPLGDVALWGLEAAQLRVVITAGGGGRPDCEPFLNAAVGAVAAVSGRCGHTVDARVVTGPLYRGDVQIPASSPARFTVTRYVPPTHSLYAGTSVVVAQAGYNTFQEAGLSGVPHVLVPGGDFGVDDQHERAAARAADPGVEVVPCDPAAIAKGIEHVLAAPTREAPERPPRRPDGARQIAIAVAALAGVRA